MAYPGSETNVLDKNGKEFRCPNIWNNYGTMHFIMQETSVIVLYNKLMVQNSSSAKGVIIEGVKFNCNLKH